MDALPGFAGASLTQTRLADAVMQHLSAAILDGRLPPGAAVPAEARLAQQFGVSKQVVREAIRQLSSQGVLQVGQGRSTRVRTLDAEPLGRFWRFAVGGGKQGLAEAVELRRMIEPTAARLAATRHTDAEAAEMRAILARMQAALGDVPGWIAADLEFHDLLARMTHNRLFLLQVRGLVPVIRDVMERFNARTARTEQAWRETWRRHEAVLDALAARHPDRAGAAMIDHFEAAEAAIAELFPHSAQQEERA